MCNYHANNSQVSASSHTQLSNELSDDVHTDIEDLKLGQQINGEAIIQSLSYGGPDATAQKQFLYFLTF
jgi:hypothetical protein